MAPLSAKTTFPCLVALPAPLLPRSLPRIFRTQSSISTAIPTLFAASFDRPICTQTGCTSFPPAGMHSKLRASVMKYLGVRVVVEGKQEPGATYVYVGAGLGSAEQLTLASVRAEFRPVAVWTELLRRLL